MKQFKQITLMLVSGMAIGLASSALALDGQALWLDPKKGGCSACHGKDGDTPLLPSYPKLRGQNAEYLYNQMKDIQSGARNNGITGAKKALYQITTDEEKKAISEWLATH